MFMEHQNRDKYWIKILVFNFLQMHKFEKKIRQNSKLILNGRLSKKHVKS